MDFSLTEDQQAIAELAGQIFRDQATNERQRAIEQGETHRFDPALHAEVAKAGLLGLVVPEVHGGAGLGFLEVAAILEQVGRHTAPVPLYETTVLGALPLAKFGSEAQQAHWLPRVAEGEAIVTSALVGDATVEAVSDGDGFRLRGTRLFVPAGPLAHAVLVPAKTSEGLRFFVVDPGSQGVTSTALETTSGQPESRLVFEDARVGAEDVLQGDGERIAHWLTQRATTGLCMIALGVCEAALELTAEYTKTRKQFDQPIAMFQAVGHRAADAYIDTETVRLPAWQAAWRLDSDLDAVKQVAVAKYFASEGSQRVVHAAQHLHGGIGVDREYPLHRHFLYARQLELSLGGATAQLIQLGQQIAAECA